jgi:hypothetical protein
MVNSRPRNCQRKDSGHSVVSTASVMLRKSARACRTRSMMWRRPFGDRESRSSFQTTSHPLPGAAPGPCDTDGVGAPWRSARAGLTGHDDRHVFYPGSQRARGRRLGWHLGSGGTGCPIPHLADSHRRLARRLYRYNTTKPDIIVTIIRGLLLR